ncbi:MAG TPA: MFS transporter [Chloroflexia bacterium]|nr:MFS transporter [Chloroflexia bacterium]
MNNEQPANNELHPRASRAEAIYYLHQGAGAFFFTTVFTILTVYFVQTVGMDPFQLVLVGTVLEGTIFIFEVPTGVVADTFSRKMSIIIGEFLHGASFLAMAVLPSVTGILVAQVVSGLAYTFTSGATEAWIAGEVGEEEVGRVFLKASQFGRAGALTGIISAVALASISLTLPLLVSGVLFLLLALFEIVAMPETGFTRASREERQAPLKALRSTLSDGSKVVRLSPLLLVFIAISFFYGMASEGIDRLGDAHFLKDFTFPSLGNLQPVVWFGIIEMGLLFLGIFCTEVLRRRVDTRDHKRIARTLLVFSGLRILLVIAFGLAGNFYLALIAFWGAALLRNLSGPLYSTWLTVSIPQRVRATVLSMTSQSDAIGQVIGGPGIGWIGTAVSIRAALVTSALLLSPALFLYARAREHAEDQSALEARQEGALLAAE